GSPRCGRGPRRFREGTRSMASGARRADDAELGPRMRARCSSTIAALACAAVLFGGCKSEAPADPPAAPRIAGERIVFPPTRPHLETLTLASATERHGTMLRLTGRIVWDEERTVRIYTPFGGRIESIQAKIGDSVRASSILATVSSPDFGQTQAELHKAEVD